jgi:hypothetical protein
LLDDLFGFSVVALAEEVVANLAFGVDEIVSRPIFIVEGAPDRIIIVDCNRIVDLQLGYGLLDVADILFEGEFRRVDAITTKA